MDSSINWDRHDKWMLLLIAACFIMAVALAAFRIFDHDELEHVHCGWYIFQGKVPYLDFFQNHNPALWFLIAPLIFFFGEGTEVLFLTRALMLIFLMGIAWAVRSIAKETGASAREATYAVLFALSCSTLLIKSFEIRPDVPQVFFGLFSCLCFLRSLKNKSSIQMMMAGFWAGVSLAFLQKSVFLFMAIGIAFLWLFLRKAMALRELIYFAVGSIIPITIFALYLVSTGSFGDYILAGWMLNMNQLKTYSPLNRMFHSLIENIAFWSLAVLSFWRYFLRKRGGLALQIILLFGMLLYACLFLAPRPQYQYFMLPIALLAVPASRQAAEIFNRCRCSPMFCSVALVLALIAPWCVTAFKLSETNGQQLQMIRYVIDRTAPGDCIYDGDIQFNIFRPDLHYFWCNVKPQRGLDSYNRISGDRFSSYDIHQLIQTKKPAFISDLFVNRNDPRIRGMYASAPFPNLYRRVK